LPLPATTTTTASCDHLRHQDATFSWKSLQLLNDTAPSPAQHCPQQDVTFTFPETLLESKDKHQATITVLRLLEHLYHTFSSPNIPAHWNDHARQRLLNQIHHYIHHLELCLADHRMRTQTRGPRNSHLAISKHFHSIHNFLQHNAYSACAWDH
ncbi:IFNB protein, partial [Penelope pileata]|nr:IFNB protein [Penelope pileata]